MRFLFYGLIRVIEATLFYFLASIILQQLDTKIPPIGSPTFIIFVLIWPFVAPIVHPGLHRIPIIGEAFSAINGIAMSALGKREENIETEG